MRPFPPRPIRRALGRGRAAWRVLIRGPEYAERRCSGVDVPLEEIREAVECILAGVRLPYRWAAEATTAELEALANAVDVSLQARGAEWQSFVARCSEAVCR